jgi:colanic acid/amylovoran biosynthesis glycosyltransferase
MAEPVVASYCATFLKPEMLHIYRQITGLRRVRSFVVCKERLEARRFPYPDVEIQPRARRNFISRFWLKHVRGEPPVVYRGEYGALAGVLARRQADLMHVYFGHTGAHLLPFIERWERPVVVSFHGMDVQPRDDRPGHRERLAGVCQATALVLARSRSLAAALVDLGCPPEKIRLNRTGIPLDQFPFVTREEPSGGAWHLVQACRLIEKKGLPVTLEAFAAFAAEHPRARLTLAGDGPLRGALAQQAAALGLADRVEFAGFLDPAALCALFHRAHVFLHPSQMTADRNQEGVPNAMLEAMATGLPVLATRHGGIPEAVEHGTSGLLSPERDMAALLGHLRELAADPARRAALGAAAAASVRREFASEASVARLEDAYFEAIARGKGGRG